jgi:hypothetical protein
MGAKDVKLVVGCSILVEVVVCGGKMTQAGSSWEEKVITKKKKKKNLPHRKTIQIIRSKSHLPVV